MSPPDVVAEHLQQVEDQVGLAPRQPAHELLEVAVDAEDRDLVLPLAQRGGDLPDHRVEVLAALLLYVR